MEATANSELTGQAATAEFTRESAEIRVKFHATPRLPTAQGKYVPSSERGDQTPTLACMKVTASSQRDAVSSASDVARRLPSQAKANVSQGIQQTGLAPNESAGVLPRELEALTPSDSQVPPSVVVASDLVEMAWRQSELLHLLANVTRFGAQGLSPDLRRRFSDDRPWLVRASVESHLTAVRRYAVRRMVALPHMSRISSRAISSRRDSECPTPYAAIAVRARPDWRQCACKNTICVNISRRSTASGSLLAAPSKRKYMPPHAQC